MVLIMWVISGWFAQFYQGLCSPMTYRGSYLTQLSHTVPTINILYMFTGLEGETGGENAVIFC